MLNLINASGLIYAATFYLAILTIQAITHNSRVQYAVIHCQTQISQRSRH